MELRYLFGIGTLMMNGRIRRIRRIRWIRWIRWIRARCRTECNCVFRSRCIAWARETLIASYGIIVCKCISITTQVFIHEIYNIGVS
jgi:hypothetical protein